MVIRGNSRGNAAQLSHYLLELKDNEAIRILDVDGESDPEPGKLHRAIAAMGYSAELSKSEKGLYHAQINPAPGEDKLMDDDHWHRAADMLGKQLGFHEQRRAIVLHTKKGRTHAHVVWERFDHGRGVMVSDSFSRLAQDRARKEMELTFGQEQTPHRNKHRPELKEALTDIWNNTTTGQEFLKETQKKGYLISEGAGRNPYMVIDENARSHNLPRQLKGVRLKDVRERLRHEKLLTEKQAIEQARAAKEDKGQRDGRSEQEKQQHKKDAQVFAQAKEGLLHDKRLLLAKFQHFLNDKPQIVKPTIPKNENDKVKQTAAAFGNNKPEMISDTRVKEQEKAVELTEQEKREIAYRKFLEERELARRMYEERLKIQHKKNKLKGKELGS